MDRGASEDVPVLIVGGSLVGLSAALFLRWHGIDVLAVERHAGTAIHSRAGHFHLRTVEILRSAGIEDAVRRKSEEQYPPDGGINNVESLAGREIANYFPNLNAGVDEFSPTVRLFINQDALEPIIRARATELGARLRYRTECMSLEQDADGVTAVIRDLESGAEGSVRAKYVVAADGNRSPTRELLGIGMHGHGLLSHSITIYFRAEADLGPLLKDRNQGVHYVTNPLMRGFFRLDRSGNAGFLVVNLVGDTSRPEIMAAYPSAPWAGLLETYEAERRPVGELTVEQAFTRYVTRVAPYLGTENTQPIVDDFSMEIGYRYNSPAVVLEPGRPPLHEHPRQSKGRPGARAPHVFLDRDGTRLSTLDLFGRNFVLLTGPEGRTWQAAAAAAANRLGVALDAHVVGGAGLADAGGCFLQEYGISPSGAVMVRPDGFVGWRAVDAAGAPEETLRQVLQSLLCRGDGRP